MRSSECGIRNVTPTRWIVGFKFRIPHSAFRIRSILHSALGLTLIEVLLSLVILATSVTVILQALARSAAALSLARNTLAAYTFSSATLSDAALMLYQRKDPSGEGSFRQGPELFRWTLTASPWAEAPGVDEVTLEVAWTQSGQAYARSVATLHRIPPTE